MGDEFYLWQDEKQKGPYTLFQIREMWRAGNITGEALFWQEGNLEWQSISELRELLEPPKTTASYSHPVVPDRKREGLKTFLDSVRIGFWW